MDEQDKKPEKLTVREQKFVAALASGNAPTIQEAVLAAGYKPSNTPSLRTMSQEIMARPRVQNALAEAIKREFPDVETNAARVLLDIMSNTMETSNNRLKAIDMLSNIFGWKAPSKSTSLKVSLKDKLTLPEED